MDKFNTRKIKLIIEAFDFISKANETAQNSRDHLNAKLEKQPMTFVYAFKDRKVNYIDCRNPEEKGFAKDIIINRTTRIEPENWLDLADAIIDYLGL